MLKQELKPMDLGGIFDKSFRLFSHNAKNCLKIFAINIVLIIIYQVIEQLLKGSVGFFVIILGTITIIYYFFSIFLSTLLVDLFIKAFMDEEWTLKNSIGFVSKKILVIVGALILSILIVLGGLIMLIIGSFVFLTFLCLVEPVILYENAGVTKSISRSFKLVSYSFWKILGMFLILILIMLVFISIIIGLFAMLSFFASIKDINFIEQIRNIFSNPGISPMALSLIIISMIVFLFLYLFFIFIISSVGSAIIVTLFFNQKIKFENFGVETMVESMIEKNKTENKEVIPDKID